MAATEEQPAIADQGLAQPQQGEASAGPLAQGDPAAESLYGENTEGTFGEDSNPAYGQVAPDLRDPALAAEQTGTPTGTDTVQSESDVAIDDETVDDQSDTESDDSLFADEEEEDETSTVVAGSDGYDD